jgi:cellulose synthase operon protein C
VATFKRLTALQPSQAQHQVRLGDASAAAKDSEAARRAYRKALELSPDLFDAQRGLVTLAIQDKRPQEGLDIARDLQKRKPKEALGWLLEGDVLAGSASWDAATAAYRGALQREARTEHAIRLHVALRQGGKAADAERLAADWMKAHPKDGAFPFYLGDVALAASQWPDAEARYRTVLERQPNSPLALNNVAWLLVKQGKPGAVALAEKAVALDPDNPALLDTLAVALAADRQLPKAIEVQNRAVALGSGDPRLKLALARLYAQAGDKVKARNELDALARLGNQFAEQAEVAQLLKTL